MSYGYMLNKLVNLMTVTQAANHSFYRLWLLWLNVFHTVKMLCPVLDTKLKVSIL